jgi:hypothetical protein
MTHREVLMAPLKRLMANAVDLMASLEQPVACALQLMPLLGS